MHCMEDIPTDLEDILPDQIEDTLTDIIEDILTDLIEDTFVATLLAPISLSSSPRTATYTW